MLEGDVDELLIEGDEYVALLLVDAVLEED